MDFLLVIFMTLFLLTDNKKSHQQKHFQVCENEHIQRSEQCPLIFFQLDIDSLFRPSQTI